MSVIVLLDAGPLGMITNPRSSPQSEACKDWLENLSKQGTEIAIPEIADYEVRRELIRAGKMPGLGRLDALKSLLRFIPINSAAMLLAAQFWASARNMGRQSASDSSLDGDMILVAQSANLKAGGYEPIIATTNVRHLVLFSAARLWNEIGR
jgi:predicted nucleic acid-binding protein